MSDRLLRDDERASRSTGHPAGQERLEARLLRAGQLDELSRHFAHAIGERRRAGSIWFGLEPAPGDGAGQRTRSDLMEAAQAQFDDSCASVTEGGVTEAVERLLRQSAGLDGEVMSGSDATELARRLLVILGPACRARLRFMPRWEPVSPHNVRLERAGSLFGRTFEAGALFSAERMTGLLWIAEGDAECRADGQSIRLEQLGVREFNFGQHWRTPGVRNVEYETVLPLRLAEDFLSRQLPDFVRDSQEHPDDHPLEVALRAAGWPGAREVLGTPVLASPALEFFGRDLLLAWAGWSPAEGVEFIANTIDAIEVRAGCVTLRGKARPAEPPMPGIRFAYQDF